MTPTAPRSTGTARPVARLRLAPAPAADGPYDDERPDLPPHVVGSLALAFPPAESARATLRLVAGLAGRREDVDLDDRMAPRRTPRAELPDPRGWSGRLAQAFVEVLAGVRPAAQLARFTSLEVLTALERSAGRLGARRTDAATRRPVVASVHISEPSDGVVEACATVDTGARRRALALRLEGTDGRWKCVALQMG